MQITWTRAALFDLASARRYIAADNPEAADRQVGRVLAAVDNLRIFPELGRPGRRAGTRELLIGRTPYIVAYRLSVDAVEVLRLLHERQQWPTSL